MIDNSPVCIDEFLPFQIPETWTWCKVKDLLEIQTGASFKKEQANANKKGIRILRGGNILPNKYIFKDDDVFVSEEFVNANTILKKNCIITPAVTSLENIGKMAVIEKDYKNVSAGGFVFIISPYIQDFNHSLLLAYFLQSPFLIEAMRGITKKSGAAFYNLGKERLKELYLPLPPRAEQQRIVAQIEKLFDSVMQDYPFGAFLFWKLSKDQNTLYDFYSFLQNYHEKNARHNPKVNLTGNDNVMAVLDGQQRLTSIYIGLKGTYAYKMPFKQWKNNSAFPERKLYLNIVEQAKDETDKYEFSFLTADEVKNDTDHYWFEVGKILDMTELGDVMNYLMQNIAFSGVYTQDQCIFANATLSQLFKVIHTHRGLEYLFFYKFTIKLISLFNIGEIEFRT